jgi:hypothetical protein
MMMRVFRNMQRCCKRVRPGLTIHDAEYGKFVTSVVGVFGAGDGRWGQSWLGWQHG